jgi:hypothetical protein
MDKIKIIELSNFKSFLSHPQVGTFSRTLSNPTRATLKFKYTSQKHLTGQFLVQPDIVRLPPNIVQNLNLSPTASFLRELYKCTSTSNSSRELAIAISC